MMAAPPMMAVAAGHIVRMWHATVGVDPAIARERARAVLRQRRFRPPRTPRIARGPFTWLGRRVQTVGGWLARLFAALTGNGFVGLVAEILVLLLLAVAVSLVVRRRLRGRVLAAVTNAEGADTLEPALLEAQADAAERAGDHDAAVRLRFVAGLARLERAGVLASTRRRTNRQVAASIARAMDAASPASRTGAVEAFGVLAEGFDAVLYGHREADAAASERARTSWQVVLEAVGSTTSRRAA